MKKNCKNCIYNDTCNAGTVCDDFYPIHIDSEDYELNALIEKRRREFRKEWAAYIKYNTEGDSEYEW